MTRAPMQFPARNAHPFEFARPVLLLAGVAFFVGFSGYAALHPSNTAAARDTLRSAAAHTAATAASTPRASDWHNVPKKI